MKAQALVDSVQKYAKDNGVPFSHACEKLGLNPRNYYAAVQRLKTAASPVVKRGRPTVAAAAVAKKSAEAPSNVVKFPVSSRQTFLVVGDPSSIAEVARQLGAR